MTVTRNNTLLSPKDESKDGSPSLENQLTLWIQKQKSLLEILIDSYCVVDLQNRVVDFNIAFTELCGESYRKVLKIGDFCELVRTESCPDRCPAKQIVTSQRSLRLDELKAASKHQSNLQVILAGVPIIGETGDGLGSLITIRNVSAESELQKKYGERKLQSMTDGLTQLFNKTYAEDILLRSIKIALRETMALSICMVDVDFFKKVNDNYGHQAGDYVLSTVGALLKNEVRDTDIAARFGGEEFIVILPKSDVKGSMVFAERFRKRLQEYKFVFDGKPIPLTTSLGTATFSSIWTPGVNSEELMKELVAHADAALYHAKQNGRNRTSQFETMGINTPEPGAKPQAPPPKKSQ